MTAKNDRARLRAQRRNRRCGPLHAGAKIDQQVVWAAGPGWRDDNGTLHISVVAALAEEAETAARR